MSIYQVTEDELLRLSLAMRDITTAMQTIVDANAVTREVIEAVMSRRLGAAWLDGSDPGDQLAKRRARRAGGAK